MMNRRHFLRTLALGTAVAPQLGEIIARASAPIPARGLMFVDFADIETKPLGWTTLQSYWFQCKRMSYCTSLPYEDALDFAFYAPNDPQIRIRWHERRKERARERIAALKLQRPLPLP